MTTLTLTAITVLTAVRAMIFPTAMTLTLFPFHLFLRLLKGLRPPFLFLILQGSPFLRSERDGGGQPLHRPQQRARHDRGQGQLPRRTDQVEQGEN
jgi:hypothetical protein